MQLEMQLSELSPRLNRELEYLALFAWDEDMYGAKSDDIYKIHMNDRTIQLRVIMDITSRPEKSFKAEVTIEPYDEAVAKVITAFFKPTNEDPTNLVKERGHDFLLLINH